MCGRCLSEGRTIHDKEYNTDDDKYELKIYPGYCSLNPQHVAQQIVIKKKSKQNPNSQSQIAQEQVVNTSDLGVSNSSNIDSYNLEKEEVVQKLVPVIPVDSRTTFIDFNMSNVEPEIESTESPTNECGKDMHQKVFRYSQLHILVIDERVKRNQERLLHWVYSLLGENTVVHTGSISNDQESVRWCAETISLGVQQYIHNNCISDIAVAPDNLTSGKNDACYTRQMRLRFTSISSNLKSTYNIRLFRCLETSNLFPIQIISQTQLPTISGGLQLVLDQVYMVDRPNEFIFSRNFICALYLKFLNCLSFITNYQHSLAPKTLNSRRESIERSAVLVFYHKESLNTIGNSCWIIRMVNAMLTLFFNKMRDDIAISVYINDTFSILSSLYNCNLF